jgi:predicted metal-dependent enzyme (double-stranded beta helix superfamily)
VTPSLATRLNQPSLGQPQPVSDDACANVVQRLVDAVGQACTRSFEVMEFDVKAALAEALASPALLKAEQRIASPAGYTRHVLGADPAGRFTVLALVWAPGQASPVHAHHTWCSYAVLDGTLTETLYSWNHPGACASVARLHQRPTGAVSFAGPGRDSIHQLGNASGSNAISIHIYGVAPANVTTHVNDVLRVAA